MMKWLLMLAACLPPVLMAQTPEPPLAAKRPHVVKSPHGDRTDDYYWLRDDHPKTKRPEVMRYLEAENAYAAAMLAPLQPLRDTLFGEMRARIREDDSTPPVYDGGWWLWRRYDTGAEYPLLMRRRGTPERPDSDAPDEVMLDQPTRAAGLKYYRVADAALSPDGQWLAWTEDTVGRGIHTLRFKNLKTGQVLAEAVRGVTEEIVWAADNRTVFYVKQNPVTLLGEKVMRHRLGRARDTLVWHEKDGTLFTSISATASRQFIAIAIGGYETTEVRTVSAVQPERPPTLLFARRKGVRTYADHLDGHWVLRTNDGAPNFRLVRVAEGQIGERSAWQDVVPPRADVTLEDFTLLKGRLAVQERVQGQVQVRVLGEGGERVLADPAAPVQLGDNRDPAAAWLRYRSASMVQPEATWDLHLADGQRVLRKQVPVPTYDASKYATVRLWAAARDGQRVPVTLAWRSDRARQDGMAPLVIEGYGAYGMAFDPHFSATRISLLDRGFVVAIAHVRGGADLGEAWYEAGRLMNKKNTFNDFVDVTDFLVRERWGAKDKVFATGGSAGGLLMGVVANQAGDRYRGMALNVPFVDILTTMLDESIPLTANEWTQWGDPRQKAAYDYIASYSPYDRIARQDYPAMLVTTGLWDAAVQYYEPAKYVARLRAMKTDRQPLLFVVNTAAGHGGSSGRFEHLKEVAREQAFFIDLAGLSR